MPREQRLYNEGGNAVSPSTHMQDLYSMQAPYQPAPAVGQDTQKSEYHKEEPTA